MKTKRFAILLCTLFLICMMSVFPAAAKSKPAPKKLILSRNEIVLYAGESKGLIVEKTKPADASSKVTWTSKNKKIADVSKRGKITAKKPGKTIITAASKKNPSIKATVRVTVKKSPAKVEKEYTVNCDNWLGGNGYATAYEYAYPLSRGNDVLVIRSEEGFREIKKAWNNRTKSNGSGTPFRKTKLAKYENMDFSQYSLIILSHEFGYIHILPEASISTKFDESGKLQGIIKIDFKNTVPDGAIVPEVVDTYTIALQLKKKDEAMIDSYSIWGEKYDKIIIAP